MNDIPRPRISRVYEEAPARPRVFHGKHILTVDDKSRVIVPSSVMSNAAQYNESPEDDQNSQKIELGILAIPPGLLDVYFPEPCESGIPDPLFSILLAQDLDKLLSMPSFGQVFAGFASYPRLDDQRRMIINKSVRSAKSLNPGATISMIGRVNRFDLFSR